MKKILLAALGNCVHSAGIYNFMKLAEKENYEIIYMGSAVPVAKVIDAIIESQPDMISVGYRLSAISAKSILEEFQNGIIKNNLLDKIYIFGGTVETGKIAKKFDFIKKVFDGTEEIEEVIYFLKNQDRCDRDNKIPPQNLRERMDYKKPFPLIRHHLGLETIQDTIEDVKKLSDSGLLDIISIAPDQNCQQYFFEPKKMIEKEKGAGGVPIRRKEDLEKLYQASRRGNYPLMRCYSGTNNLLRLSALLKETLNNAWAAIPLMWYSDLDRRAERDLLDAIKENQEAIKWNAQNHIPVEINESHQWALRYAHDALEVAIAYIVGYNAKYFKVKDFVMQFMLCTPPSISPKMDLAKMLAKIELIKELEDDYFKIIKMVRTGLLSYSADPYTSKGQLAGSMFYGNYLEPDILHIVAYCEAIHRATAKEIIESVKIVKGVLRLANAGIPNYLYDKEIINRKNIIKKEARLIIKAIQQLGREYKNPLIEAEVLYNAVKLGVLDAPGLKGFSVANGNICTEIDNGAHVIVKNGKVISERERLQDLGFDVSEKLKN
ncbi:methionine synthase [Crassaminicella profunda]|uniref:methionine synthase n=1 Tax=Crassaminicella profunda TaxID=1286698 RepID=UPI001CA78690|nr:methionine synthase [Crassaminicella profunda]QZY56314.1 methionine synthase [Crassaminicella profunda]